MIRPALAVIVVAVAFAVTITNPPVAFVAAIVAAVLTSPLMLAASAARRFHRRGMARVRVAEQRTASRRRHPAGRRRIVIDETGRRLGRY